MASSAKRTYKVVLVGEAGVGKTTWMRKLRTDEYEKKYVATLGVEVHSVKMNTNRGEIVFDMWDTAGQEKFSGIREGYYVEADGAFALYDFSHISTFTNLEKWILRVRETCPSIPIVLVGNKKEFRTDSFPSISQFPNIAISVRDDEDICSPLLAMARLLTGDDSLMPQKKTSSITREISIPQTVPRVSTTVSAPPRPASSFTRSKKTEVMPGMPILPVSIFTKTYVFSQTTIRCPHFPN